MINQYKVESIIEYKSLTSSLLLNDDILIFRPYADNKDTLTPEINNVSEFLLSKEKDVLSAVLTYGNNIFNVNGSNNWRLLCIAKQLGFDTRLLEWTSDAIKALGSVTQHDGLDAICVFKVKSSRLVCFTQCHEQIKQTKVFKSQDCNVDEEDGDKWFTCHPIINDQVISLGDELEDEALLGVIYLSDSFCNELRKRQIHTPIDAFNMSVIPMEEIQMKDNYTKSREIEEAKEEEFQELDSNTSDPMETLEQYGRKYHADFDFD